MKKIVQRHKDCIGCGTCVALCPKFWEMGNDDKARPKSGKKNPATGDYEFEIGEADLDCNKEAADSCPARVIDIK